MIRGGIIFERVAPSKLKLDSREVRARLGCFSKDNSQIKECESELIKICRPGFAAARVPVIYDGGALIIDGERIESASLMKNFDGATEAFLLVVTLGIEVDRYLKRESLLSSARGFVSDGIASAMAEALCEYAEAHISCGLSLCKRFSPGYGDLPLSLQGRLLARLSAAELLGITLTKALLMIPSKSITAIIGIKNEK